MQAGQCSNPMGTTFWEYCGGSDAQLDRINVFFSPTHKRTEGRAPVWGSEFTTHVAEYRGDSAEAAAGLKRNSWD
jgi:hypothetical protein